MATETKAHIKMGHKSTRKKGDRMDHTMLEKAIAEHL